MLCFLQVSEPVGVQTLGAERPIEAFHERIVRGLSWSREVDLDTMSIGPQIHRLAGELAAVVTEQHLRHASTELYAIQRAHNVVSFQALSNFYSYCLSREHIDDGQ